MIEEIICLLHIYSKIIIIVMINIYLFIEHFLHTKYLTKYFNIFKETMAQRKIHN
jgi:hypothetical protein